jgi:hypothetical protein
MAMAGQAVRTVIFIGRKMAQNAQKSLTRIARINTNGFQRRTRRCSKYRRVPFCPDRQDARSTRLRFLRLIAAKDFAGLKIKKV